MPHLKKKKEQFYLLREQAKEPDLGTLDKLRSIYIYFIFTCCFFCLDELCVEALCRMEQANCSFQVFDKHPGIYLFLVHPNEMVSINGGQ